MPSCTVLSPESKKREIDLQKTRRQYVNLSFCNSWQAWKKCRSRDLGSDKTTYFGIKFGKNAILVRVSRMKFTGCPKKNAPVIFFSHYWHKYFTHMENKDRYGILIISAFHAIFCFYSTPFQFFAIIRQSMSPPIFIHFILHLFKMSTITCNAFVASSFDIQNSPPDHVTVYQTNL